MTDVADELVDPAIIGEGAVTAVMTDNKEAPAIKPNDIPPEELQRQGSRACHREERRGKGRGSWRMETVPQPCDV